MLSYVLNAASSYVRYTPLGPHFGPAPSAQAPTDLSKVNNPREASESSLFDTPSSASTSPSSSRESSTWDSSSDSSDASTSSSSSRQSSSSSASSSRASQQQHNPEPEHESESNRYAIIEDVLRHENLYDVLGVTKSADLQALRRAYITRSKRCHPDKFPENPLSTLAFQKVSFAYDTLSDTSTRRTYDRALASARHTARRAAAPQQYHPSPDDTLNAVLYGVFCDFMDGDYEIIRTLLRAVGEINQRMAMGDDTIESLLQSLMRLREVLLVGRKYIRIIRFELIRMYEIQHNLRQLSYFDVRGRLRLTLQLARVGLSLPVVVDTAMRSEDDDTDGSSDSEREEERPSRRRRERSSRASDRRPRSRVRLEKVQGRRRRGLLPPPVSVVIGLAIGALEIGESVL